MPSGNFVIGEKLPLSTFDLYVAPYLSEKGYRVEDKLSVDSGHKVLVSIVGEGDLEARLDQYLGEASDLAVRKENEKRQRNPHAERLLHGHEFARTAHEGPDRKLVSHGKFQTIGVYQDEETATKLFTTIAQQYLLKELERNAYEVCRQVNCQLSKIGQKLIG